MPPDALSLSRTDLPEEIEKASGSTPLSRSIAALVAERDAALARVERLESVLQQMLKPFPCVSGPPEDALEDLMAAVSRFRAAARSALSEAQPQGDQ